MENKNEKRIKLTWNKKIVSISFLALALFMLLAVSYAYFTATVTGNDTAKKTTVTTGTMGLKLTGPTEVTANNMVPGDSTSITFTVENTGTVPAFYNLDMKDVTNNFNPKSDLVYSVESEKGANKEGAIAPSENGTLIPNIYIGIGDDKVHEYTLTITFKETYSNQNSNQGKTFTGIVQISGLKENAIATNILMANSIQDSTEIDFYYGSPKCSNYPMGEYAVSCPGAYESNGTGLYMAPDDDGSSYYFRGVVTNNNVTFANKKWKIIRINGDGSIRLIYNDEDGPEDGAFNKTKDDQKYVGFTYNNTAGKECTKEHPCEVTYDISSDFSNDKFGGTNSDIKTALENWYSTNLKSKDDKIAYGLFCNDVSYGSFTETGGDLFYGPSERGIQATLICPDQVDENGNSRTYGGLYKTKIGLITVDELHMVGYSSNPNVDMIEETNYLYRENGLWTMSPESFFYSGGGCSVYRGEMGYVEMSYNYFAEAVVPVINLNPDVTFTGDGTESNPYTIS